MTTPLPETHLRSGHDDGAVFDRYVDEMLAGRGVPPEEFLRDHPGAGEELRRQLRSLWTAHGDGSSSSPVDDDLPFERLGDFRLLHALRSGGMGTVYEAEQTGLRRRVALKVVRADIRGSNAARARFEREAAVLARLVHPHIVTVHAFGTDQGVSYLAMEYVEGRGLDELLRDVAASGEPLVASDVVRWGAEVARALACAHEAGIVHRDVKPANVRITPEGRAVLLDFGVARDEQAQGLTATGLVGSPLYAAPEQIDASLGDVDARTDIYGLGATLYECLAGRAVVEHGTVEQVLHRKLHDAPASLHAVAPHVARDLRVVVMKALARDPARRYATAAEFADDLEAVLAFQPIRARPPGVVERLRAWTRRRPAFAAAAGSLLAAGVIALVAGAVSLRADARERVREARTLVTRAAAAVETLAADRERTVDLEREVERRRGYLEARHQPEDDIARLDVLELEAARLRRERQDGVHAVLELLRRAERLDPEVKGTDAVRAALHLERFYEARTWGDYEAEQFHGRQLRLLDPEGEEDRQRRALGRLRVVTSPAGAEVHAFRLVSLRDLGGTAPRQVPVPIHDAEDAPLGKLGLRVARAVDGVPSESLVIAVGEEPVTRANHRRLRAEAERDGGDAVVLIGGRERNVTLPPGVLLRPTASPLFVGEASRFGVTPVGHLDVQPGPHVLLIRKAGYEDVRLFVSDTTNNSRSVEVTLLREGTTPAGFVRVIRSGIETPIDLWMMEREVTAGDYLAFLDDVSPRVADPTPEARRVPRGAGYRDGYWPRGEDGRYALPDTWSPDMPVTGISHPDALAYAAWLTERTPPPEGFAYGLATWLEWSTAAGNDTGRTFVFGNTFRPHWCASCFSKENANLEPVMDYPVDESPFGVYDLMGSAAEWSSEWWDEPRGLLHILGGSWAQARPEIFKIDGGAGQRPTSTAGDTGFRLVLRRVEDGR